MPRSLGSSDYKDLETHNGQIGGRPAVWRVVGFTDRAAGPMKRFAVSIGTSTGTYHVDAMAKQEHFETLRPLFEGIAGSFQSSK